MKITRRQLRQIINEELTYMTEKPKAKEVVLFNPGSHWTTLELHLRDYITLDDAPGGYDDRDIDSEDITTVWKSAFGDEFQQVKDALIRYLRSKYKKEPVEGGYTYTLGEIKNAVLLDNDVWMPRPELGPN